LSRCQRFDFHRLTAETIAQRLQEVAAAENLTLEPRTAMLLARSAEGSLRDGLGLLDQCISFCGSVIQHQDVLELLGVPAGDVLTDLIGAIGQGEAGTVFTMLADLRAKGRDPRLLLKHLTFWLRNLLLLKVCREPELLLALSEEEITGLQQQSKLWRSDRVTAALTELTGQENTMRFAADPWIVLEATLAGLCLTGSALGMPEQTAASEIIATNKRSPETADATKVKTVSPKKPKRKPATAKKQAVTPSASPVAAADSLELENIKAAWPQVLQEVRAKGPALEAVWRYGEPWAIQGNTLKIAFEAEGIKNVAAQPDKLAALQDALRQVLQTEFTIRPETVDTKTGATDTEPPLPEEPPGIAEAKALFGADKVVIREKSEE
jgi:DNA polymerase-3 subunit gamma/tau